jgi:hypothetical protein
VTAAQVVLGAIACAGVIIVNWMGKYPPDSFSEVKRWTFAVIAAGVTMAAVGGIVAVGR